MEHIFMNKRLITFIVIVLVIGFLILFYKFFYSKHYCLLYPKEAFFVPLSYKENIIYFTQNDKIINDPYSNRTYPFFVGIFFPRRTMEEYIFDKFEATVEVGTTNPPIMITYLKLDLYHGKKLLLPFDIQFTNEDSIPKGEKPSVISHPYSVQPIGPILLGNNTAYKNDIQSSGYAFGADYFYNNIPWLAIRLKMHLVLKLDIKGELVEIDKWFELERVA